MMKMVFASLALLIQLAGAKAGPDEDAVRHLLHGTFDKPEARLTVDPVVVVGIYAMAGWSQGDMGGRALLRHKGHEWSLILCAGDGIKTAEALRHAGIASADAAALADKVAEAEARLPRERIALFSKFEGVVMMNADGSHPPVHHGGSRPHGH